MKFLFTTQASNDFSLLTRSLPIASELKKRGHEVAFCNPAKTSRLVIADAGFDNLIPRHPAYNLNHLLLVNKPDLRVVMQFIFSKHWFKCFRINQIGTSSKYQDFIAGSTFGKNSNEVLAAQLGRCNVV